VRMHKENGKQARRINLTAVVLFALLLRFSISWISYGTNDITTWLDFARAIHDGGLVYAYRVLPQLNHPPLAALWAAAALSLARHSDQHFAFIFRIPAMLADAGSCLLLVLIWQRRATGIRPWIVALAMALNLDAILVSAYHGNTDSVYAFFSLLAVYLMCDLRRAFLAGVALAAAINVKLIPVVLIAPILAMCRNRRDAVSYLGGLSLGAIPFAAAWIATGPAFYHNALSYTSDPNRWGIIYALRVLRNVPHMHALGTILLDWYHTFGRFVVLGTSILLAILHRRRAWDGYRLAAAAMVAMLVFAPGFAVQYTVAAAPLLLAVSLRAGSTYGFAAGVFLFVTYMAYGVSVWPPRSQFEGLIPHRAAAVGVSVWILLVWMLVRTVRTRVDSNAI
jgi:hypothetical protein